ncbi:NmrA family NAD(P)-binding protein [Streptomyces sp. Je 1-79]|uniref:SDR family oxidoreductase n=1 Tax=Streptomyces sp. Je 1-79 TaxID=2943847 RepID=UPI0021A958FE|nr:NmrA family NAD(P)-binding protein [Streptomyces sp. Je 1-79]MCT4357840.1 NmrA family NAD(P)-binding protein [Streptomyces sp. Je 1-79]
MNYVIHGATGAQGAPVVAALTANGASVTALTRNADAVVVGAQVRAVDLDSAHALADAYRAAGGVFVHLPLGGEEDRLSHARNIVTALNIARPGRVVFSTSGGTPVELADRAVTSVIDGLKESGLSHAVIAPRLFLENLLLPPVLAGAREQGVLRYPLRADHSVSWASHLDVADAAVALFDRPEVTGVIEVGRHPAVTGPELAEAFAAHLGHGVTCEALAPAAFGDLLAPLLGSDAAAGVAGLYAFLGTLPDNAIASSRSAQRLLGLNPRTTARWLTDMGQ